MISWVLTHKDTHPSRLAILSGLQESYDPLQQDPTHPCALCLVHAPTYTVQNDISQLLSDQTDRAMHSKAAHDVPLNTYRMHPLIEGWPC